MLTILPMDVVTFAAVDFPCSQQNTTSLNTISRKSLICIALKTRWLGQNRLECLDRSVATRIDAIKRDGAHLLSTQLLEAKGCVIAKDRALEALESLRNGIPRIEEDMEKQIAEIFGGKK